VTATIGAIAATPNAEAAGAEAWRAMRASSDLQFVPIVEPVQKPPPEWLVALGRVLGKVFSAIGNAIDWALGWLVAPIARFLGMTARTIEIALIVVAGAGLLWTAWSVLWPRWRARRSAPKPAPEWTPDTNAALALLEDADALAAAGRYDEAARLLLHRSVGEIAASQNGGRPDWLEPSTTAREIGANPRLPWRARQAFMVMAREVERSLFALTGLVREDWERARAAYAEFALAEKSSATP
jgi:hypothetical protein